MRGRAHVGLGQVCSGAGQGLKIDSVLSEPASRSGSESASGPGSEPRSGLGVQVRVRARLRKCFVGTGVVRDKRPGMSPSPRKSWVRAAGHFGLGVRGRVQAEPRSGAGGPGPSPGSRLQGAGWSPSKPWSRGASGRDGGASRGRVPVRTRSCAGVQARDASVIEPESGVELGSELRSVSESETEAAVRAEPGHEVGGPARV